MNAIPTREVEDGSQPGHPTLALPCLDKAWRIGR